MQIYPYSNTVYGGELRTVTVQSVLTVVISIQSSRTYVTADTWSTDCLYKKNSKKNTNIFQKKNRERCVVNNNFPRKKLTYRNYIFVNRLSPLIDKRRQVC